MCLEFTIMKKLYICFNVYRPLHINNLDEFFEEITVYPNKAIIRYENVISSGSFQHRHTFCHLLKILFRKQLNKGGLMKNDELTTDLVLSKKLTSFQKLTGDYHKLIVNNHALTLFKCHVRYGILQRTTKNIWGFLVFSKKQFFCDNSKKNAEGLTSQRNLVVSVLPKSSKVAD